MSFYSYIKILIEKRRRRNSTPNEFHSLPEKHDCKMCQSSSFNLRENFLSTGFIFGLYYDRVEWFLFIMVYRIPLSITMTMMDILWVNYIIITTLLYHYTGCPPKKRNGWFSVHCELKVPYIFTSLNKASSAEENDTKIIEFGWVILILCPFLETESFSSFSGVLRPMSVEFYRETPFIWCFHCFESVSLISM